MQVWFVDNFVWNRTVPLYSLGAFHKLKNFDLNSTTESLNDVGTLKRSKINFNIADAFPSTFRKCYAESSRKRNIDEKSTGLISSHSAISLLSDWPKTTVGKSAHKTTKPQWRTFCPGQIVIRLYKNKRLGSFVFLLSIRAIVFIVNSSFVLFAFTKCLKRGFRSKFERLLSRFY